MLFPNFSKSGGGHDGAAPPQVPARGFPGLLGQLRKPLIAKPFVALNPNGDGSSTSLGATSMKDQSKQRPRPIISSMNSDLKAIRRQTLPSMFESTLNTDQLSENINKCMNIYVGQYIPDDPENPLPRGSHANENLSSLYDTLNKGKSIGVMPENVIIQLFSMIESNIFHNMPEIPKQYIMTDQILPIYSNQWKDLEILYKIFLLIIRLGNRQYIRSCITDTFLQKLLRVLDSPDPNEHCQLDQILKAIAETIPSLQENLTNAAFKQIDLHKDGIGSHFSVTSCLTYVYFIFNDNKCCWSSTYTEKFQNSIFPLFNSNFLPEFYASLTNCCQIYYEGAENGKEWGMSFILKHWPKTSSQKQVLFINQISIICRQFKGSVLKFVKQIFQLFAECLSSSNFKVASAALQLLSDPTFLLLFSDAPKDVINILLGPIQGCLQHWSEEVQGQSSLALAALNMLDNDLESNPNEEQMKETNDNKQKKKQDEWMDIAQGATNNDPDLCINSFITSCKDL